MRISTDLLLKVNRFRLIDLLSSLSERFSFESKAVILNVSFLVGDLLEALLYKSFADKRCSRFLEAFIN